MIKKIELLSPAGNAEIGIAAVDCGADAVYIGAPKFGARKAAGTSIEDIKRLTEYAHPFGVNVFAAVNTLFYDEEIEEVRRLIFDLYDAGIDGIIFQDFGLLEMDLPPVKIIASTQTDNYHPERIRFIDSIGVDRIILARELSLRQIKEISQTTQAELEFFVHGALCVSFSGRCYISKALFDRSGNRGECAQFCRMAFDLLDENENPIIKNRYPLSLKDLNLSDYLKDLIDAGISSFKIEGRLKDVNYVKNVTAFYRNLLDEIIDNSDEIERASVGKSYADFVPAPEKSFNRGFTSFFINGKADRLASLSTPKSTGELIGKVIKSGEGFIKLNNKKDITTGDGLCYFDNEGNLNGFYVNKIANDSIFYDGNFVVPKNTDIYRNFDRLFEKKLELKTERKIDISFLISLDERSISIKAECEDGVSVSKKFEVEFTPPAKENAFIELLKKQFSKTGNTIYNVKNVGVDKGKISFLAISQINGFRRETLKELTKLRVEYHEKKRTSFFKPRYTNYYKKEIDYRENVVNRLAENFYIKCGAEKIERGLDYTEEFQNKPLMTSRYCILEEIGICRKTTGGNSKAYYLKNRNGKFELKFDCKNCLMEVYIR
ncbi:peptidase u32 [Melioribacter roseus P3M-2]|uniref:Peptidase u32 n=1 Tax=Melioribacter roseus (strain DSM 23840 / JCM 17771 / VKM B-2668 / P3M-2) TaxID=1191523 RepID=I6YZ39_MELRP|nr:U32 family peptidase [Melioribacter roseus]AFN75842.1 peptidase u32 [Melioribacter roseus P3M-2]